MDMKEEELHLFVTQSEWVICNVSNVISFRVTEMSTCAYDGRPCSLNSSTGSRARLGGRSTRLSYAFAPAVRACVRPCVLSELVDKDDRSGKKLQGRLNVLNAPRK